MEPVIVPAEVAAHIARLKEERDQARSEVQILSAEISSRTAAFVRIWQALRIPATASTSFALGAIDRLWREHDALGIATSGVDDLTKQVNDLTVQRTHLTEQVRILQEGVSYVANYAGMLAELAADAAGDVAGNLMTLLINVLDRVDSPPTSVDWGTEYKSGESRD